MLEEAATPGEVSADGPFTSGAQGRPVSSPPVGEEGKPDPACYDFWYTPDRLKGLLPYPDPDANKYTRGRLVVVAGSAAYPGAACLAAHASQRTGAGYVEVLCAPESVDTIRRYRPSLVVRSWEGCRLGELVQARDGRPAACVIGSGFSADDMDGRALLFSALREVSVPLLVDGGALASLATGEGLAAALERAERGWSLVVTPHGGEAAHLERAARLQCVDVERVDAQRAVDLARAYRCVVTLKGPDTYIAQDLQVVTMSRGQAALAKAGTGDVLAGMMGALLAQGTAPMDAAVLAATLHAEAGCAAADLQGQISVTPEDVIAAIPDAIRRVESLS